MNIEYSPSDMASSEYDEIQLERLLEELPQQYQIEGKINQGGMGSIFKAQNRYTAARVAIKLMHFASTRNAEALKRFYVEAKAASLLKHASICRLLDFGVTQSGFPYLVMDWIEGKSLDEIVLEENGISLNEAILVFKQVAAALGHAHQKQIVHRDLKPENIMLSKNPEGHLEVQLVDFGIAKLIGSENSKHGSNGLTQVGFTVGTPRYMSPEQAAGEPIDYRTDLYSLGCVMYFALSGSPPFLGETVVETLKKHVYEPPPPFDIQLKIPSELQKIVFKALEKKREKRFANADELILELDKFIAPKERELSTTRQNLSPVKKIPAIVWFLLSFLVMYGISILIQKWM